MISTRADVLSARRGDATAFARLVHGNTNTVCAITTAILGSPTAGEEVGQEVFVCAWQGLGTLEDPERFGAWIRGIARNRARDSLRTRLHRREVAGDVLTELADPAPDPGERLDDEQREATLWSALEGLDDDHREVLVLYYREGRSVSQVAEALELTEPTVRKRLSRARERLRDDVEVRLEQRLVHTAPRQAAFALAVATLLGALAPVDARAAVGVPRAAALSWGGGAAVVAAALLTVAGLAGYDRVRNDVADLVPTPASVILADVVAPELGGLSASVPDDDVPEQVTRAFLAAEDVRFFEHGAMDFRAIGRAALHWSVDGVRDGGSTLTQQLAKRLLSDRMPRPGLRRKVSEMVMAVEIERRLTKDEILAIYLDDVYLGAGTFGLADAARVYFDKPVGDLTLAEGALLAGIPAHPQACGPFDHPEGAERRRAEVLDRMEANGWASPSEVAAAKATPLPIPGP